MDELIYWIWLSGACDIGSKNFLKLIEKFGTVKAIYEADNHELNGIVDSRSREYKALQNKDLKKAESVYMFCKRHSVGVVTYGDAQYPNSLRNISDPPVLFYYRGVLPDFNKECFIAVVGTRHLSDYGRKNTFKISRDLSLSGAHVVSGMAIGIDGVALAGAISGGTSTVAVLGCGIDICYPSCHLTLAREIVKNGCVITEYAPGTRPSKCNFPKRNRIMSGISSSVIVMEGREKSGSLITARHGREQGRKIYAFPGNVGNPNSEATNLLIKNGAALMTSADDVIRDYQEPTSAVLNPFKLESSSRVDMTECLLSLKVSCVAKDDDIFRPSKRRIIKNKESEISKDIEKKTEPERKNASEAGFSKELLALYKKIPTEGECSVESLVDGEHTLVDVMQGILRLEIGGFIKVLPGDRVKRNL